MRVPVPNVYASTIAGTTAWVFDCDDCGRLETFDTEDDGLQYGNDHYLYHCPNTDHRDED